MWGQRYKKSEKIHPIVDKNCHKTPFYLVCVRALPFLTMWFNDQLGFLSHSTADGKKSLLIKKREKKFSNVWCFQIFVIYLR